MRINKNVFLSILLGLLYLTVSLIFYGLYQLGDQVAYRAYWKAVENVSFLDSYHLLQTMLSSTEPGYAVLAYVFSGVLPKDLIMSLLNGLMGFYISHWLFRRKAPLIIVAIIPFNFYVLVLMFAAERLKLSIVLLLAAEHYGRHRLGWYALAICSHVTSLLLVLSAVANQFAQLSVRLLRGSIRKSHLYVLLLTVVIGLILAALLGSHFMHKVHAYLIGAGLSLLGMLKVGGLIALASLYARKKYEPIIAGVPIFIAAMLVGPDRLAMFGYFLFVFYAFQYHRGINLFNIILIIYFMVKGFYFLEQVVLYGTGFYAGA